MCFSYARGVARTGPGGGPNLANVGLSVVGRVSVRFPYMLLTGRGAGGVPGNQKTPPKYATVYPL